MSQFTFNDFDSENYWDDQSYNLQDKSFGHEFSMSPRNSGIFTEVSKVFQNTELPRFIFPDLISEKKDRGCETVVLTTSEEEVKPIIDLTESIFPSTGKKIPDDDEIALPLLKTDEVEESDSDFSAKDCKKRWNRNKDKSLFKVIRSLEKEGKLSLEELISLDASKDASSNPGVCILAKKFRWKSLKKFLLLRIQSLSKRDFSVRETKALKKILKKEYQYKDLDYSKIIEEFPGKTVRRLEEVCDEIIRRRFDKTLTSYFLKQR